MANTDWDKELAKIDKQLASVSDEELLRSSAPPPATTGAKGAKPAPRAAATAPAVGRRTRGIWVLARVLVAAAAAGFVLFWPYPKRCGLQLGGYLAATGAVAFVGTWASVWSWRHRSALGHLVGLAATACGLVLAALEVLPRVGYAIPTASHPAAWSCSAQPAPPVPAARPEGAQPQGAQPPPATPQPATPQPAPQGGAAPSGTAAPPAGTPAGATPAPAASGSGAPRP